MCCIDRLSRQGISGHSTKGSEHRRHMSTRGKPVAAHTDPEPGGVVVRIRELPPGYGRVPAVPAAVHRMGWSAVSVAGSATAEGLPGSPFSDGNDAGRPHRAGSGRRLHRPDGPVWQVHGQLQRTGRNSRNGVDGRRDGRKGRSGGLARQGRHIRSAGNRAR